MCFRPWSHSDRLPHDQFLNVCLAMVPCGHNLVLNHFWMCFWPWSHLVTISHSWFWTSFCMCFWPWSHLVTMSHLLLLLNRFCMYFWPWSHLVTISHICSRTLLEQFLHVFLAMVTFGQSQITFVQDLCFWTVSACVPGHGHNLVTNCVQTMSAHVSSHVHICSRAAFEHFLNMLLAMFTFGHNSSHLFKNCLWTVSEHVSGHGHIWSQFVTFVQDLLLNSFCMCFWPWSHLVTISHICPRPAFEQFLHVFGHGHIWSQLVTFVQELLLNSFCMCFWPWSHLVTIRTVSECVPGHGHN